MRKIFTLVKKHIFSWTLLALITWSAVLFVKSLIKAGHDPRFIQTEIPAFLPAFLFGLACLFFLFILKNPFFPREAQGSSFSRLIQAALSSFLVSSLSMGLLSLSWSIHWKMESYLGQAGFLVIFSVVLFFDQILARKPAEGVLFQLFKGVLFLLGQAAVVLFLLEILLTFWTPASLRALLVDQSDPAAVIRSSQPPPGYEFHGFPLNSGGFHDREFSQKSEDNFIVQVLADSFGFGVVPYESNFITLMEEALSKETGRNVFLNNFGVNGANLFEYWHIYKNSRSQGPFDAVLLCLFVGNDISMIQVEKREHVWNLFQWETARLIRNFGVLLMERKRGGTLESLGNARGGDSPQWGGEKIPKEFHDETQPTMSPEKFLSIERGRFDDISVKGPSSDKKYQLFFYWLERFVQDIGEPLVIAVIPDEFQINDELFSEVSQGKEKNSFDRFLPQKKILDFCRQKGLTCVDLSVPLASAQASGSVYKPRDTHWNRKGNQLAAEALTPVLREKLGF